MGPDEQLRQLAERVPAPPPGNASDTFRRGQHRRRRKQVIAGSAAAAVVAVVAMGAGALFDTAPQLPDIADQPEQVESVDDVQPDGWVVLRAGGLELSVPPDWQVHTVEPAPESAGQAGPCAYDLYGGIENLYGGIENSGGERSSPLAVVYPMETTGMCRAIGLPDSPPERPSLVLYAGVATPDDEGVRPQNTVEERIGGVRMLRVESEPHEHIVEFQQRDGRGGLLVSHLDDPIVQQVLDTLRPTADQEEPSEDRASDPPEAKEPVTRTSTPEGESVVELVFDRAEVSLDEPVSFWLANRGEVDLSYGLAFAVERWDDGRWVEVPWPEDFVAPALLEPLPVEEESTAQRWPLDDQDHASPGWYRITWEARWEDEPDYQEPAVEIDVAALFEVVD